MSIPTQDLMPNKTILSTTFNIIYNGNSGTAFLVDSDKGQLLITAKHIFGNVSSGDNVQYDLVINNTNQTFSNTVFIHSNLHVDIAVVRLGNPLVKETLSLKKGDSYFLAQRCLFLGYPLFQLGSQTDIGKIPFVKSAIISAFHEENKTEIMLLDGHNNVGFSGGPVITYSEALDKQFIIGVISGYIIDPKNVNVVLGSITTQIRVNENSGIIISYAAEYIYQIIETIV